MPSGISDGVGGASGSRQDRPRCQALGPEHDIQTGRKTGKTSRTSRAQRGPKCDQPGPKFNGVMRTGEARGWIRWSRQTWRPGAADTKSHLDWEQ